MTGLINKSKVDKRDELCRDLPVYLGTRHTSGAILSAPVMSEIADEGPVVGVAPCDCLRYW